MVYFSHKFAYDASGDVIFAPAPVDDSLRPRSNPHNKEIAMPVNIRVGIGDRLIDGQVGAGFA